MVCAVSTACINRFLQDGRDNSAFVGARTAHIRRVDPPVGENGTVAIAGFWKKRKTTHSFWALFTLRRRYLKRWFHSKNASNISVHATLEEFLNATITGHFRSVSV